MTELRIVEAVGVDARQLHTQVKDLMEEKSPDMNITSADLDAPPSAYACLYLSRAPPPSDVANLLCS